MHQIWRNSHVAREFNLHPSTITKYISLAQKNKNDLILEEYNGKFYIQKNEHNKRVLSELAAEGIKHRNQNSLVVLEPQKEFYEIFKDHLGELIIALEKDHEILHKFTYLNGGAKIWQSYAEKTFENKIENTVSNATEMADYCLDYVLGRVPEDTLLNIIDIGVGDATPVRNFLKVLSEKGRVNKYFAVDFSEEMIDIAEKNIHSWFGDAFAFEKIVTDIAHGSIRDQVFIEANTDKKQKVVNLFLFLGSTIENQPNPQIALHNLSQSLSKSDYLFLGRTLDTPEINFNFDIAVRSEAEVYKLPLQNKWIVDLLGVEEELYDVKMYYKESQATRKLDVVFNKNILIKFDYGNFYREVYLDAGTSIALWRHSNNPIEKIITDLKGVGLTPVFSITSRDQTNIVTISKPVK